MIQVHNLALQSVCFVFNKFCNMLSGEVLKGPYFDALDLSKALTSGLFLSVINVLFITLITSNIFLAPVAVS